MKTDLGWEVGDHVNVTVRIRSNPMARVTWRISGGVLKANKTRGEYKAHAPVQVSTFEYDYTIEMTNITLKMGRDGLQFQARNTAGSSFKDIKVPVTAIPISDQRSLANHLYVILLLIIITLALFLLIKPVYMVVTTIQAYTEEYSDGVILYCINLVFMGKEFAAVMILIAGFRLGVYISTYIIMDMVGSRLL